VLDQLQVPELAGEVSQLNRQLLTLETQVGQLGRIVDQNLLDTQAQINVINTTLGNQTDDINNLTSDIANLDESVTNLSTQVSNLGLEFTDLSAEVATFDTRINNNTSAISSANFRITILDSQVGQLETQVRDNSSKIQTQQTQIDNLFSTVSAMSSRLLTLESQMLAVIGLPGIVTPGVVYTLNNQPTTNAWVRNLTISGTYGTRVRFGEEYTATFNGQQHYIKFLDQFGSMSVTSAPRDMAVNVGLQRFAYRLISVSAWTLTTVNVSKFNN